MKTLMEKEERINLFQMYIKNGCRMGFYVTRDSWRSDRYAKVTAIECVTDGFMIEGEPPYFGGLYYPLDHPRVGEIMRQRSVTIEADWLDNGKTEVTNGGVYTFTQVYPKL